MIGIGAFAQLTGLTVRALRHYDELGLLTPERVDRTTGYRSYSAAQLARVHRLVALRDLGLSLPEVRKVLDAEVSTEELRGMLRLRQAEARTRITEETERLARVEARLAQLEKDNEMSDYEVVVKSVEPVRAAVRRYPVPRVRRASGADPQPDVQRTVRRIGGGGRGGGGSGHGAVRRP